MMDREPPFVHTNGMGPEDAFPGPMTRRLCICHFQCPLCLEDHEASMYISLPVDNRLHHSAPQTRGRMPLTGAAVQSPPHKPLPTNRSN